MDFQEHYLTTVRFEFGRLRQLAEGAMAQIPNDDAFHVELDAESNSIAVIVQHLSGNMVSRWTDFLTTDGEKPDRHRDAEFEPNPARTRAELMELWERGWAALESGLGSVTARDLDRTITIRGESLTVPEAIQRQLVHGAYHVGQVVYLARHASAGSGWKSLSIPKGQSQNVRGSYKKR